MAEPGQAAPGRRPIPTWYYGVGAAALAVVYFLYKKSKGSTATTATTGTTAGTSSTDGTAASSYGNANDLSALLPYLQAAGNAGTATPSGAFTPPTGEVQQGSGYYTPGSTTPVTGADGHTYSYVATGAQAQALNQGGSPTYYQPVPGVFQQIVGGVQLAPGTPQYAQVQ